MANYRVTGMSTAQVKELQSALGVKADGAWGRESQAALERAYGGGASARDVYLSGGGSATYGKTGGFGSAGGSRSSGSGASRSTSSASRSTGSAASGHTTYGNGAYGGKYLGSNQSAAYQNMQNAPGSTGYERGTLTGYVRKIDESEPEGYRLEQVTREGVLPLGTRFTATGAALKDAANVPDSSGIFAYAKGRTPGYIEHASGYTGYGYQDAKGNFYDSNGNYIREDGYYYEPGARISKNGMYQDTGSGMGYAGYGMWGGSGNYIAVQGSQYGRAPGSYVESFSVGTPAGRRSGGRTAANDDAGASGYAAPQASAPAQQPAASSEYERMFEEELRRYLSELTEGY